jgi:hypothetical protein
MIKKQNDKNEIFNVVFSSFKDWRRTKQDSKPKISPLERSEAERKGPRAVSLCSETPRKSSISCDPEGKLGWKNPFLSFFQIMILLSSCLRLYNP